MSRCVVIIDAMAQLYRMHGALPPSLKPQQKVNIVNDLWVRSLLSSVTLSPPSGLFENPPLIVANKIVVCFDQNGGPRRLICPIYKANRKPKPPEMNDIFTKAMAICDILGIQRYPKFQSANVEADDLIDTAVSVLSEKDPECLRIIVSPDKDLLATLRHGNGYNTVVYRPRQNDWVVYQTCQSLMGVTPERIRDLIAIIGDSSDNIVSVKELRSKAFTLIRKYPDIEAMISNLKISSQTVAQLRHNVKLASLIHVKEVKNIAYRKLPFIRTDLRTLALLESATCVNISRYGRNFARTHLALEAAREIGSCFDLLNN